MTDEQFRQRIGELERFAKDNPQRYRVHVCAITLLGYAIPVFLCVLCLAGIAALVPPLIRSLFVETDDLIAAFAVAGMLLLFVLLMFVSQSIWTPVPKDDAYHLRLAPDDPLTCLVEEIRRSLDAPRIHALVLSADHNAGVQIDSRLGVLGWERRTLEIGLPLLESLTTEELASVIAHEFGHLSGGRMRLAAWVYRTAWRWDRLQQRHSESGDLRAEYLLGWLMRPYFEHFMTYTFVLRRQEEYAADRCAADFGGPEIAARALMVSHATGLHLSRDFWPALWRKAATDELPPRDLFAAMAQDLRHARSDASGQGMARLALRGKTWSRDTHPSTDDRVAALGFEPDAAMQLFADGAEALSGGLSSAHELLGERHEQYMDNLNRAWRASIIEKWRAAHARAKDHCERLEKLEESAAKRPLSGDDLWTYAWLRAEYREPENALEIVREYLKHDAAHAQANYAYGERLLEKDDAAGIAHLEQAMETDMDLVTPACKLIHDFLKLHADEQEVDGLREKAEKYAELIQSAHEERSKLSGKDEILAHEAGREKEEEIIRILRGWKQIRRAYLVKKTVEHYADRPCHVLLLETEVSFSGGSTEIAHEIRQRIHRMLPYVHLTYLFDHSPIGVRKKIKAMPEALIYDRKKDQENLAQMKS